MPHLLILLPSSPSSPTPIAARLDVLVPATRRVLLPLCSLNFPDGFRTGGWRCSGSGRADAEDGKEGGGEGRGWERRRMRRVWAERRARVDCDGHVVL